MQDADQIPLSKNGKILLNLIEIRLFDLSQALQVAGHKFCINQVKESLQKQYNIFGQIEKIFDELKIHKLYELMKKVSQNYISLTSIMIDEKTASMCGQKNQPVTEKQKNIGANQQKFQKIDKNESSSAKSSPRLSTRKSNLSRIDYHVESPLKIKQKIDGIKAQQLQVKNKLGGIHLYNQNYHRGVQSLQKKFQALQQKKKKNYDQKQLIRELIFKQISDQADVQKLYQNDEVSKFIKEGKVKHELYNHIEYEKDLESISAFLKQSQDDAIKFLIDSKKNNEQQNQEEIIINYHELIEILAEKKKTEYQLLQNKIKEIVDNFKAKLEIMDHQIIAKEQKIVKLQMKLKKKEGKQVETQTLKFAGNFNTNRNSLDAIQEMEEQHKIILEILKKNLDSNQKQMLLLETDVRSRDQKIKKKELQVADLCNQIEKLKKSLKQEKLKSSQSTINKFQTKQSIEKPSEIENQNQIIDQVQEKQPNERLNPSKMKKRKPKYSLFVNQSNTILSSFKTTKARQDSQLQSKISLKPVKSLTIPVMSQLNKSQLTFNDKNYNELKKEENNEDQHDSRMDLLVNREEMIEDVEISKVFETLENLAEEKSNLSGAEEKQKILRAEQVSNIIRADKKLKTFSNNNKSKIFKVEKNQKVFGTEQKSRVFGPEDKIQSSQNLTLIKKINQDQENLLKNGIRESKKKKSTPKQQEQRRLNKDPTLSNSNFKQLHKKSQLTKEVLQKSKTSNSNLSPVSFKVDCKPVSDTFSFQQNNSQKLYSLLFTSIPTNGRQIQIQEEILQLKTFITKYNQRQLYNRLKRLTSCIFRAKDSGVEKIEEKEDIKQENNSIQNLRGIQLESQDQSINSRNENKIQFKQSERDKIKNSKVFMNNEIKTDVQKWGKQSFIEVQRLKGYRSEKKIFPTTEGFLKKLHRQIRISGKGFNFTKKQFIQFCQELNTQEINSSYQTDSESEEQVFAPSSTQNSIPHMAKSTKNLVIELLNREQQQCSKHEKKSLRIKGIHIETCGQDTFKKYNSNFPFDHQRKQSQSLKSLSKIDEDIQPHNLSVGKKIAFRDSKDISNQKVEEQKQSKTFKSTFHSANDLKILRKKEIKKLFQALRNTGAKIQSLAKFEQIVELNKLSLQDFIKISALIKSQKPEDISILSSQECENSCKMKGSAVGYPVPAQFCCSHVKKYSSFLERVSLNNQSVKRMKKDIFVMHILNIDAKQSQNEICNHNLQKQKIPELLDLYNIQDIKSKTGNKKSFKFKPMKQGQKVCVETQMNRKFMVSTYIQRKQIKNGEAFDLERRNICNEIPPASFLPQLSHKGVGHVLKD